MKQEIKFQEQIDYSNKFEVEVAIEGYISPRDQAVISRAIERIRLTVAPYLQAKREKLSSPKTTK